jgi:hypothetical protein
MIIILILAAVGLVLNIIGRWFILRQDSGLAHFTRLAVAFCPGAELAYLIVRWERARIGAGMCALSMALAIPLVGHITVVSKKPLEGSTSQVGVIAALGSLFKEQAAESKLAKAKAGADRALKSKTAKVDAIRSYLVEWYANLAKREPYLCSDMPEETEAFNRDAAAYHGLLSVSKSEAVELDRMKKWVGTIAGK